MKSDVEYNQPSHGLGLLSPKLTDLLRGRARRRHLAKNEVLYSYGSSPDSLFCVDRGQVRLSVTSISGRESILSIATSGQWFGEASLFAAEPRIHDACAMVDSDLLVVPVAKLYDIVDQRPAYLLEFIRLICRRYRLILERVDAISLLPFPVRLAQQLLAELHTQGQMPSVELEPVLRISQENVAHMLGASRQSVNRQLKEWEARNILRLQYGRIMLLNQGALQDLVREWGG